jgi:hypothetical protein
MKQKNVKIDSMDIFPFIPFLMSMFVKLFWDKKEVQSHMVHETNNCFSTMSVSLKASFFGNVSVT